MVEKRRKEMMNTEDFEKNVDEFLTHMREILISKNKEYSEDGVNRLHNFERGASVAGCSPLEIAQSWKTKHSVSISDMCSSGKVYSKEKWFEKLGDEAIYDILLYCIAIGYKKAN